MVEGRSSSSSAKSCGSIGALSKGSAAEDQVILAGTSPHALYIRTAHLLLPTAGWQPTSVHRLRRPRFVPCHRAG